MLATKNVFSLLFFFLLPVVSVMANVGVNLNPTDSIPKSAEVLKLERIDKLLIRSPHYKNPNAAGRVAVINRNGPAASSGAKRIVLTGPAYKNRKQQATPIDTTKASNRSAPKLVGPRYKNRRAKAHRPQ